MGLKANICQVCGGALKNCGTYYKCMCCDTEYRIDEAMSKEEMNAYFRKLNAFEDAERNLSVTPPRFDEAESEFGLIVQKYPDWSAGYWGLVRAKFGIKFEQDLSGKAVPSCYKSSYEDFRDTDEYKKAVALAETNELRQSYEKMAEYIARVTKEWREEAQKYDYDVFISFKASNDLDGSETRDAREMHKLYDLLKDKGYRVFFSPVTLITDGVGGRGSEPYIFNALDKAKALIVYGSRKEYFSSTWVQNEWQRYLRAIKAGKKEKDSLIVLYEGFNPKELPQGLRRIQGIEYGISAYPAVLTWLKRLFDGKFDENNILASQVESLKQELAWFKASFGSNEKLYERAVKDYKEKRYEQAVLLFKKLANDGFVKAFYGIGKCYFCGSGVEQDLSIAFEWYKKAAERGDVNAQTRLGNCYLQGWGIDADGSLAIKWYQEAAIQGDKKAQKQLYRLDSFWEGIRENIFEKVKWLQIFAKGGEAEAQNKLGDWYYYGIGVKKNEEKAAKWYVKAAEQGNFNAMASIWSCCYYGKGMGRNVTEAERWRTAIRKEEEESDSWFSGLNSKKLEKETIEFIYGRSELKAVVKQYKKGAMKGDAISMRKLAECYDKGVGLKEDWKEAIKWYHQAAEKGDIKAQLVLGGHYWTPEGGSYGPWEDDNNIAEKWYRVAAESGSIKAQIWLGDLYMENAFIEYENEPGEPNDIEFDDGEGGIALDWYEKAEGQGSAEAQYKIGKYFENLRYCYKYYGEEKKIYGEAMKWYKKAAEHGNTKAQNIMGGYYEKKGNIKIAMSWYQKAALQGDGEAQFTLGEHYYWGKGIAQDKSEAFKWYFKAGYSGIEQAKEMLQKCSKQID